MAPEEPREAEEPAAKQARTGRSGNGKAIGALWGAPTEVVPRPKPGESVTAAMTYQGEAVPRSLVATGKVKTIRDGSGSDGDYVGCDFVRRDVPVTNGRGQALTLNENGFALVEDKREHIDYYNHERLLKEYYPAVCELIKRVTGAREAYAFDHNVRSKAQSDGGAKLKGGSAVQGPAFVVHGDYTVVSAPRRVRDLAKPPKVNDTLRQILGDTPLLDPETIEEKLKGRWALINVWRNIKAVPVQKNPLGLCDATSVPLEDMITFEIHYTDRIGENYFARQTDKHKWYYFPEMTRDEAILLKCWDSRGADFAGHPESEAAGVAASEGLVPATLTFHSAFEDPSSGPDADDRESIEVRTVVFY